MELSLTNIGYILSIVISLGLIILLALKSRGIAAKLFVLLIFSITTWLVSNFLTDNTTDNTYGLFFIRSAIIGPFLMGPIFFLFVKVFPHKDKKLDPFSIIISLLSIVVISPFIYTDKNISSITLSSEGAFDFNPGILYEILTIYLIAYFGISFFILSRNFRRSKGNERMQITFLILGFSSTFIISFLTNLIAPLLGITQLGILGPLSTLIFFITTTYSLLKHRLLGVRVVIGRALYYTLLAGIIFAYINLVIFVDQVLFTNVFADSALFSTLFFSFLFIALYDRLENFIKQFVDRNLIDPGYTFRNLQSDLSKKVSDELDLSIIAEAIVNSLNHIIVNSGIMFYIHDKVDQKFVFKHSIGNEDSEFNVSYLKYLEEFVFYKNFLIVNEFGSRRSDKSFFLDYLKSLKISYVIRLKLEKSEILIFISSEDALTEDYIVFINKLLDVTGVAISRSLLYEEVQQFNKTLQHKIDEATEELRVKNIQLDTALRKEKDMMDVLGHELRTPLGNARNAVLMMEDLKATNKLTDELYDKYIKIAIENIRREKDLIQTILQSARLENDRFQITKVKFDAAKLMESAETSFKAQAEAKGLKFEIEYPKQEVLIYNDQTVLQQILDNFMTNAIKYTYEGSIKVALEDLGEKIRISVKDTGEGLKKEDLQHIGKKFFRANTHLESQGTINGEKIIRPGGTGIGLYVVKGILKNLGSDLKIDSEFGKGSTFSFEIKKDLDLVGKEQPTQAPTTNSLGELAVEPSSIAEVNRKVLESQKEVIKPIAKPKLNTKLGK